MRPGWLWRRLRFDAARCVGIVKEAAVRAGRVQSSQVGFRSADLAPIPALLLVSAPVVVALASLRRWKDAALTVLPTSSKVLCACSMMMSPLTVWAWA